MESVLVRALFATLLACVCIVQHAHADTYTWTDANGRLNFSNVAPPEGASIENLAHAASPRLAPPDAGARDNLQQAEVTALASRVRQLESEVVAARREVAEAAYVAPPPPPMMQYSVMGGSPPAQPAVDLAPLAGGGCDPMWTDCYSWGSPFYPASVVVVRPWSGRHFHNVNPGRHYYAHRPGHASGAQQRHR
jgi:hypothetical protein